MPVNGIDLTKIWREGYSIAELWGHTAPVTRGTSAIEATHGLMWGILGIVEYQVDKGAGHRYLRQRIETGDWIGIGYAGNDRERLEIVPPIKDAKFGRRKSEVGGDNAVFIDVRIVHRALYDEMTTEAARA